eukprot:NODE_518_length_7331_cov_0.450913.p5 type:complete len:141 gc:universal NODE_518_length_7331_cov_0.450913:2994-2572(-)
MQLLVQKLSEDAQIPQRHSEFAAGYDIFASKDTILKASNKGIVPTDLAIAIPEGYYGRIAPRSSLAAKHFIDVGAGVIDSDYRGPVGVVLFNFNNVDYSIKKGDRIAQLVIEKIGTPEITIVDKLPATVRGSGGFGSTGK